MQYYGIILTNCVFKNKRCRRELCFEGDKYYNLKRLQAPLRDDVDWNADMPIFNTDFFYEQQTLACAITCVVCM